jgi:hypothetical protein
MQDSQEQYITVSCAVHFLETPFDFPQKYVAARIFGGIDADSKFVVTFCDTFRTMSADAYLPENQIKATIEKYHSIEDLLWCQRQGSCGSAFRQRLR